MTLKEKAEAKAKEYQVNDVCRVWNNGCPNVYYASMQMFEWAKKEMIEKACEWLKENKDHAFIGCEDPCLSGYLTDEFINEFKKAMEE